MRLIDRYLGRGFLKSWAVVTLVLVGLFSFLELVREMDDIDQGGYRLADAFTYVGLTVPGRLLDLAPVSALLGSIIALGVRSESLELLALRAAGISEQRLAWSVVRPGLLLSLAILLLAQFIIPPMEQMAWFKRELALSQVGTYLPEKGFWSRGENRFINVASGAGGGLMSGIDIYRFDEEGRLQSYLHAARARTGDKGSWELEEVTETTVAEGGGVTRLRRPSLVVGELLTTEQTRILGLPPQALSLTDLYRFIMNLRERDLNSEQYQLALWQKLALPVATAAMVMLSFPFVFGPARRASLGWRIMAGGVLGVALYFFQQVLAYLGLMLEWNPVFSTLAPALLMLAAASWMVRRFN